MAAAVALELIAARRRAQRTLVAGVALGSTGYIAAVTVATLVAKDLLGSEALAGAPGATVVLGSALGALLLSSLMARRGRRPGHATGYGIGVAGALLAGSAVLARSFPLLLVGTVLIGFGNSSTQLARYTAADMVPTHRRASAIGTIVWGSTIGSVVGPALVPVAGGLAPLVGLPTLAGPYLIPIAFVSLAAILSFAFLRPDPYELADRASLAETVTGVDRQPVREVLRRPGVAVALVALIVGQFVMTLIMTMTPLHMTEHGQGLVLVGVVLSAHTLGMFALSPVSGRLTDRFGPVRTIFGGTGVLAASAIIAALAPMDGGTVLLVGMFLLGFGWNLGFVAGSTMLSEHLEIHERTRIQGLADGLIWSSAAAAALGSGLVVAWVGYTALGILGAAAVIIPILTLRAHRQALAHPHGPTPVDAAPS